MQQFVSPLDALKRIGAIMLGHFVGTSWMHMNVYADISKLGQFPRVVRFVCHDLMAHCESADVVLGPAGGAEFIVRGVAEEMGYVLDKEIPVVLAHKKKGGGFIVDPSDMDLLSEVRVVAIDDALNTGGTLRQFPELVSEAGGVLVGAAVACTHQRVTAEELGFPWIYAAAKIQSQLWTPAECLEEGPCSYGVRVNTKVGHGDEFAAGVLMAGNL